MLPTKSVLLVLFVILSLTGWSQKVKYKDVFSLLSTRQYDQAEPFLKRYLQENNDNPNAYLYMGIILQERALKADVLRETESAVALADSSVLFYAKALAGITEKELRRNDEYYQIYNRRDLRTGEFGVKLSDVQLDIEKRTTGLKEHKEKIKAAKTWLQRTERLHAQTHQQFKNTTDPYLNNKELYLRATDSTLNQLRLLSDQADSTVAAFNQFKGVLQSIGKTGYNPSLTLKDIKDFKKDGLLVSDFTKDNVTMPDYEAWAQLVIETLKNDIKPTMEQLVAYDVQVNKLRDKLKKDSASVVSDMKQLQASESFSTLKKYDAQPMPLDLFDMKMSELEFISEVITSKAAKDSVNALLQLKRAKAEWEAVVKLDSAATRLAARNLTEDALNYKSFVSSAYGTASVLKSLAETTKDYAQRERNERTKKLALREEAYRWLIVGKDSIPVVANPARESRFKPLIVVEEKYTAGLMFADSIGTGYLYSITPSRTPDVKVTFPVDKKVFKRRSLPVTKALSITDASGFIYFVLFYSETKVGNKFPVSLAKIYRADGLAWSNNYMVDGTPSEITFNASNGVVSMKINGGASTSVVNIDKSGKLLK